MSERKKLTIEVDQLTIWRFGTFLFAVLFIISLFTGGFGIGSDSGSGYAAPSPSTGAASPPTRTANVDDLDLNDNYFKGSRNAKVTIVEFSDFQCPFCGRFYSETLSQIEQNYINNNKVKFVYADFPLESIHPNAFPAALAARCAGEQDKFWEFHDKLFENQALLSESNYKQWAQELGLDTDKFNSCFDSKKYENQIRDDFQDGSSQGISGTPGFIINNQLVSGAQPYQVFEQAIEAALAS